MCAPSRRSRACGTRSAGETAHGSSRSPTSVTWPGTLELLTGSAAPRCRMGWTLSSMSLRSSWWQTATDPAWVFTSPNDHVFGSPTGILRSSGTRFEGLRELDAVGSYYDVACARVEDDVHVLVYDGKANGIRHAQGIWSGPWLLEFIDTQSLGLRPGSVACTRAAPVSGRMWGAGAVGALMARARFLYPRRAGERRLNGSVTTPVASRRTISSTSRFTGYAAEAHGSSTSDRRSSL